MPFCLEIKQREGCLKKIEMSARKMKSEKILNNEMQKTMDSYFGLLSHCKVYNLKTKIKNRYLYRDIET